MNPFVFCSYSYTKECFPQVTANMMAAIAVPDLSSNSEKKEKNIKQYNVSDIGMAQRIGQLFI